MNVQYNTIIGNESPIICDVVVQMFWCYGINGYIQ